VDPAVSEWEFIGRHKAHAAPVSSLAFSSGAGGSARLVSCGEDRTLVEYDLARASVQARFIFNIDIDIDIERYMDVYISLFIYIYI